MSDKEVEELKKEKDRLFAANIKLQDEVFYWRDEYKLLKKLHGIPMDRKKPQKGANKK